MDTLTDQLLRFLRETGTHATSKVDLLATTVVEHHQSTTATENTILDAAGVLQLERIKWKHSQISYL